MLCMATGLEAKHKIYIRKANVGDERELGRSLSVVQLGHLAQVYKLTTNSFNVGVPNLLSTPSKICYTDQVGQCKGVGLDSLNRFSFWHTPNEFQLGFALRSNLVACSSRKKSQGPVSQILDWGDG